MPDCTYIVIFVAYRTAVIAGRFGLLFSNFEFLALRLHKRRVVLKAAYVQYVALCMYVASDQSSSSGTADRRTRRTYLKMN